MPSRVAVINAGGWGTALAVLLGNAGHEVRLWCRRGELASELSSSGENRAYLPGVSIPRAVHVSSSLEDVLTGVDGVLLVPISRAMRSTSQQVAAYIAPNLPVLHATKGFEL